MTAGTFTYDEHDSCWRWRADDAAEAVFSSRAHGNIGAHVGDDLANVLLSRSTVARLIGLDATRVAGVTQVHGSDVWLDFAISDELIEAVRWSNGESPVLADALVTRRRDIGVAVGVADCLPIAISWGEAVAVVHAGWRGLVGGVIEAAVRSLQHAAGMSAFLDGVELRAAIGPALGACCFEVGEDVASQFPPESIIRAAGVDLPHLDARADAHHRLTALGAIVDVLEVCTRCDDRLFSHRGDGPGGTGRQAVVARRATLS